MMLLGIDPGEIHCGYAVFCNGDYVHGGVVSPTELCGMVEEGQIDIIVIEEFRLYPWLMQQQGFSEMKTVEVIGAIQYIADKRGIEVIRQPASIKKVARIRLKSVMHNRANHIEDAELHSRYWIETHRDKS